MSISTSLMLAIALLAARAETACVSVPDPQAALRPETADQGRARHAEVARARDGTVIVLHRGAWSFAPENTLSAIRAGFELGANGVELDFRRTKDGVIVFFHDDRLERLLDGVGSVEESYYEELLFYTFNTLPAPAAQTERVPTLRDVLQLVRDHAGLLHLDIKDPGIDGELLQELQNADMLDHVVTYNDYNSEAFRQAGVAKLRFKGSLMDGGKDVQPSEAEKLLQRPGNMIILDDPRALLTAMGRPPVRISRKPTPPLATRPATSRESLEAVIRGTSREMPVRVAAARLANFAPGRFCELATELGAHPTAETRWAVAWNLGMIAKHRPELVSGSVRAVLVRLLGDPETSVRSEAAVACGRAKIEAAVPKIVQFLADRPDDLDRWTEDENRLKEKRTIIEARARYAFALGLLGVKTPAVIGVLTDAVKHRAMHRDRMLVGLDGAMAARALGRLRASDSVDALSEALFRNDPALDQSVRASERYTMQSSILPALAEIGGDRALSVLKAALDEPASRLPPYMRPIAADALLNTPVPDRPAICARLLAHKAPEIRRSAVIHCLRQSDPKYRRLLERAAPWALPWWDVQHPAGER